jgi:predicted GNAT superfamily acetyltransferase
MSIEIRPVAGLREYAACEQIQRAVWGDFGVVPDHMLLTAQRNGGLVLGAFDTAAPGAPMVGFVFGFLGRAEDGQLKHASHMAAVLPAYRDGGLGARLKWAQRDHVLSQGLTLMTWTFDPLLSRNAQLNITRLGAVCRTYIRNIYGPEPEDPRGDLPSDRFRVDWWLADERVVARRTGLAAPLAAAALRASAPLANPDPQEPSEEPLGAAFLIQIPANVEALKAADIAKARAWRYQVRALAETAFAAGYHVSAFARDDEVGLYLLERAG